MDLRPILQGFGNRGYRAARSSKPVLPVAGYICQRPSATGLTLDMLSDYDVSHPLVLQQVVLAWDDQAEPVSA